MILNLSLSFSEINEIADKFDLDLNKVLIIDCSTFLKIPRSNFFSICDLENFDHINDQSTRDFIREIGTTSLLLSKTGKPLRNFKVYEYNLFWYSALGVKRPDKSLGKTVYLLDRILPLIKDKIGNEKVYVSIPKNNEQYIKLIKRVLKKYQIEDVYFTGRQKGLLIKFLKYIKGFFGFYLKTFLLFLKPVKQKEGLGYENYFISPANKQVDEKYDDFFLADLKRYSETISRATYWPVFSSYKFLKSSSRFFPAGYQRSLPSILQVCKFMFAATWQIFAFKWPLVKQERGFFDEENLLRFEIKNSIIENLHIFFYGIWLRNYFSAIPYKVNVIYQDEFYSIGRVVSNMLEQNKNVTTIGVQHGIFDLHHTVYGISDVELKPVGNAMPAPDVFVLWGHYFKDYFISNNSFDTKRLMVLGNPRYFGRVNEAIVPPRKIKKILWCTDSPDLTRNDIQFLENTVFNNPNFQVTLRMYPLINYLNEFENDLKIFKRFPAITLSENTSIIDDINAHDLIIVNCFTTVFLDAYLSGKFCFRLFPYTSSPAYIKHFNSKIIFNIYSEEDIVRAFKEMDTYENGLSVKEEAKGLMNIDVNGWEQLILSSKIVNK